MTKFMFLYNGPATDMADMDPQKGKEVMEAWGVWMQGIGSSLVEMGTPLANGTAVVDDGSEGTASTLSGYSIVEADDMAAAQTLAKNHPFLSEGSGKFCVEVHEMQPVPEM